MTKSEPVVTTKDKSYIEMSPEDNNPAEEVPYCQPTGSLMYLIITTRPDIEFAIGKLSQHSQNLRTHDWVAVKRFLRYISGTRDFGTFMTDLKHCLSTGIQMQTRVDVK